MFSLSKKKKIGESLENTDTPWDDKIKEDFHVAVFRDKYPVSQGHLLFVPKYNTPEVVEDAFYDAYNHGLQMMEKGECEGFNIGMNIGKAAGQTVMYPHVHLIPRLTGDCADPTGGIRNVIPGKGKYNVKD